MTNLFLMNVLLSLAWAAVTGSFTLPNLILGFIVGSASLWLIREQFGTTSYFRRSQKILSLVGTFIRELVMSTARVAWLVLAGGRSFSSGIIAFPLTTDRDIEITVLANLITLTPGTLSMDVSDDRTILYIHAIDVPDAERLITDIASGFEAKIMAALR